MLEQLFAPTFLARVGKKKTTTGGVDMIRAIDMLGDSNIFTRARCARVFGWNGAPFTNPGIPFSEEQLACALAEFTYIRVFVRYAPLTQLMKHGVVPHIPSAVVESERRRTSRTPSYRLVAWGTRNTKEQSLSRVRKQGMRIQRASFTTGLSALLLDPGVGFASGDMLKLRLDDGVSMVAKSREGQMYVRMVDSRLAIPSLYELRVMKP